MPRKRKAARAAARVSLAVLISRLLGLVRELTIAAVFGAGAVTDAWLVAFRIPGMLRDLVAEGALSSAFIPTFNRVLARQGREAAWQLASLVMSALMLFLGAIAILFYLFSDTFVYLFAFGFGPGEGKFELTSTLIQIISPFVLLVALSSVAMGMLNTFDRFFLPAVTAAFFNLAIIGAALLMVPWFESRGVPGIYAVGFGALAGGALQILVQTPTLARLGFRFRFRIQLKHPDLVRIGRLIGPAVLGVGVTQFAVMINTILASTLGDGPISWLNFAFRIIYLPIGLFGVAIGIVNLREVSAYAAEENWKELKETVANSLRMVLSLAIPSTLGLMVLATPIVGTIFERGRFDAFDTRQTAAALILYTIGLTSYSCVKIYTPTFFALNDSRSPVRVSMITAGVHVVTNLLMIFLLCPPGYEFLGLAFTTSLSLVLHQTLLMRKLHSKLGSFQGLGVGEVAGKALVSSLLMAGSVFALSRWLAPYEQEGVGRVLALGACIALGAVVYLLAATALKLEEVKLVINWGRGSVR